MCLSCSAERDIQELLEFRCVAPLRTVYRLLAEANGLALLADPLVERATAEIMAGGRPRQDIQRDIKAKERAREALVRKHRSASLPEVRAWSEHTSAARSSGKAVVSLRGRGAVQPAVLRSSWTVLSPRLDCLAPGPRSPQHVRAAIG